MEVKDKKILKAVALEIRHLLEGKYDTDGKWHPGDLEQRLAAIGIRRKHNPAPIDELPHLSNEDKQAREVADVYLTLRQEAGVQIDEAVREFVSETAYTWANRLLALRCMEARELIDEVILQKEVYGGRSLEHHRLAQRQPELCTGEDDGLFAVFEKIFADQAKRLPILFDPKAPGVALRPSPAALKDCIGLLSLNPDVLLRCRIKISDNQSSTPNPYIAPDALGWAYQYWNTEEKDRVFEKVRTQKGAKIEGADIIPATQLYTEPYMVKFLVQNSLGALWMGMHPDSKLYEQWEYYVRDADRAPVEKKPVREITFLDPACGSGHFLLEAFDLFYSMYKEEAERGWGDDQSPLKTPKEICKSIFCNNLFGIDIDERAVQIAEVVLWMKAAEKTFDFEGVGTNLVASNICLPKNKNHLLIFLENHPEDMPLRPALEAIFDGLQQANELGSLLKIEELVEEELRYLKETFCKGLSSVGKRKGFQKNMWGPTLVQGQLPIGVESYKQWKEKSLKALKEHFAIETKSANLAQAFFSRFVRKGIELFEILTKHYDTVAANPPYMGSQNMGDMLKKYIQRHYASGKRDLYAVFILRCLELTHLQGKVAMVTQHSWMFLRSFSDLRAVNKEKLALVRQSAFKGMLLDTTIETLAHLGPRAFGEIGGEVVNIALFTVAKVIPASKHKISAFRLIGLKSSEEKDHFLLESFVKYPDKPYYQITQNSLLAVPESPLIYWLRPNIFRLLQSNSRICANNATGATLATVHIGLCTGNNARYIRFIWEVPSGNRWKKCARAGKYQKWWGLQSSVATWRMGSDEYAVCLGSRVQNTDKYFSHGLTYSFICSGSMGARLLDDTEMFEQASMAIIPTNKKDIFRLLAILNNRVSTYLLRVLAQGIMFNPGYVELLPIPVIDENIDALCCQCVNLKKLLVSSDLTEHSFVQVIDQLEYLKISSLLHTAEAKIESMIVTAYKITRLDLESIWAETGRPAGLFPLLARYDELISNDICCGLDHIFALITLPKNINLKNGELSHLKSCLHNFYKKGLTIENKDQGNSIIKNKKINVANGDGNVSPGVSIPVPAETSLEGLSQKLQIHPISIYWLLKEGIEKEGWRCTPEEQCITADRFTVMILHLLGHRWPKQIESGEPVPDWSVSDGIIPLTEGINEHTLLARVRERIAAEFEGADISSIERKFAEIMGNPLDQWLETEFFKHHTKQFKKRPIAWQIQSSSFTRRRKPAFACLLYYHKIDGDILPKLSTQYIGPLRQRFETELRGIETIPLDARSDRQEKRRLELEDLILELKDFDLKLQKTNTEGFACKKLIEIIKKEPLDKWCSIDGIKNTPTNQDALLLQEQAFIPDINDGVRVNIVPLQKAGLLASDVLAKKDVDKATEDRAEWRADERRWCREGKLPQLGWWRPVDEKATM